MAYLPSPLLPLSAPPLPQCPTSSPALERRPQPSSTFKPLAEKRSTVALTFSPTPVSRHPLPPEASTAQYANSSITSNTSSTTTRTTLINLNEVRGIPHDHGFCGSQSQTHTSPCSLTYQRRNHLTVSTSSQV